MVEQPGRKFTFAVPTTRAGDAAISANDPKGGEANSLQKFATVHASMHNHFNHERHLVDRQTYKLRRSTALAQWQSLMA